MLANFIPLQVHAQAPDIEWRRFDWLRTNPITSAPISQNNSGEDWWYDHVTSYGAGNIVDGYVGAGFSTIANWALTEAPFGGCLVKTPGTPDCGDMESPGHLIGTGLAVIAKIDPSGAGNPTWYRTFNEGAFLRVIQTSDGGFAAIGATSGTHTPITGSPLYYNPNQKPGYVTDQFAAGIACTLGNSVPHITVAKVDHNGNVLWQYVYGMIPYRPTGIIAAPHAAYVANSDGWGITEAPDGGLLLVGNAADPNSGIAQRCCMIKIASNGYWKWGAYYGPGDQQSNGSSVTTYGTGSGLRYVVAATEYIPGSTYNSYSGSNLYQRAALMQFDGSGAGAPTAPQWIVHPFENSTTSSQATYDVRIQKNAAHDILWPVIVDCVGCLYTAYNRGEGEVYRVSQTGSIAGVTSLGAVTAYDLKVRVDPTADGGFGVISTKRPACPPDPYGCFQTGYWRTDAYVARANACGEKLWDTTFDDGNVTPAPYPANLKLQECMYSISEGADGGFVVSGNNSNNFDDSYLTKLLPEHPIVAGAYMQDTPYDNGVEPNPDGGPMWLSKDIWIRNLQDPPPHSQAHVHQNPVYRNPVLSPASPNYIYVKVRNAGCDPTPPGSVLKVYVAAASTAQLWPTDWTTNISAGGFITLGEVTSDIPPINVSIGPNAEQIYEIPWFPPDPYGADAHGGHVCCLARVEKPPYPGMTYPEVPWININARNNNDIVCKNLTVVSDLTNTPGTTPSVNWVGVANIFKGSAKLTLTFAIPTSELADSLFTHYDITAKLGPGLMWAWKLGRFQSKDVTILKDSTIHINTPGAFLSNIVFAAGQKDQIGLTFSKKRGDSSTFPHVRNMDLVQSIDTGRGNFVVGGERYEIAGDYSLRDTAAHGTTRVRDDHEDRSISLESVPNPTSDQMMVRFSIPVAGDVIVRLYDGLGRQVRVVEHRMHEAGTHAVEGDIAGLPSGTYLLELVCGNRRRTASVVVRR